MEITFTLGGGDSLDRKAALELFLKDASPLSRQMVGDKIASQIDTELDPKVTRALCDSIVTLEIKKELELSTRKKALAKVVKDSINDYKPTKAQIARIAENEVKRELTGTKAIASIKNMVRERMADVIDDVVDEIVTREVSFHAEGIVRHEGRAKDRVQSAVNKNGGK